MSVVANFATTATDGKTYVVEFYNLDMILSIGYRVKSKRGIQFRRWANSILKQYLLSGCAINNRLVSIEGQLREHRELIDNNEKKIDFFVRTSMPPVEGIFFDGQIYDAHSFVSNLIRKAKQRIIGQAFKRSRSGNLHL